MNAQTKEIFSRIHADSTNSLNWEVKNILSWTKNLNHSWNSFLLISKICKGWRNVECCYDWTSYKSYDISIRIEKSIKSLSVFKKKKIIFRMCRGNYKWHMSSLLTAAFLKTISVMEREVELSHHSSSPVLFQSHAMRKTSRIENLNRVG